MLRIVPHTVPRVGRAYEHFPDGFELHLLPFSRTRKRPGGEEGTHDNLPHAINFMAKCVTHLVTYHPGIEGGRKPRTPPRWIAKSAESGPSMKRESNQNLSGNAVDYRACSSLVIFKNACGKLHYQKDFDSILFS
jgi:hypothetical protein